MSILRADYLEIDLKKKRLFVGLRQNFDKIKLIFSY